MDVGDDIPREFLQPVDVPVDNGHRLGGRKAHLIEQCFGLEKRLNVVKLKKSWRRGSRWRLLFLPLEEGAQGALQVVIDWSQDCKTLKERLHEFLIGEQAVDHGENEKSKVNRELPGVFQIVRLLIAQTVVTERIAGQVGFIHHPLNLLRQTALAFEIGVVRLNGVGNQGVVNRNEIAARAVKRIGEATGLADQRPALRADSLPTIVRKIDQAALVENFAVGKVARKDRPLAAGVLNNLLGIGNLL